MKESISAIISSGKFPPVLLLFGEEDFLIEEAYHQLVAKATEGDTTQLNYDTLDGNETSQERIAELAGSFPMMADRRVVVVKHFDALAGGKTGKKAVETSPLSRYLKNPSPSTFLLLLGAPSDLNGIAAGQNNSKMKASAEKKIKSAKFPFNIILEHSRWIEFPKYNERDVPSWIAERFKMQGRTISPEACEMIAASFNGSLRDVHNEIVKVLLFVGDKKNISRDEIASLVGGSKTHNVFELQKAVGQKNVPLALEIAEYLVTVERQELLLISMLTRYFTVLWKLFDAQRQTRDNYELSKTVGINVFFIPEYIGALQKYSLRQLEQAFFALKSADLTLKTSRAPVQLVIPKMLLTIMENTFSVK